MTHTSALPMRLTAQLPCHHCCCCCHPPAAGCPIDVICNKGAGSSLLLKPRRLEEVVRGVAGCINKPVIVKIRCVWAVLLTAAV